MAISDLAGSGLVGAPNSAQVAQLVGEIQHAGYPSGKYTWMCDGTVVGTTNLQTADLIYFYPFTVKRRVACAGLFQICLTGGAGSAVKSAIWRNDPVLARPTGLPIMGQNAGYDTTGTGNKIATFTAVTMDPDVYWCGSKFTGTAPILLNISSTYASQHIATAAPLAGASFMPIGFSTADAYANDIMAFDATAATLAEVNNSRIPITGMVWA